MSDLGFSHEIEFGSMIGRPMDEKLTQVAGAESWSMMCDAIAGAYRGKKTRENEGSCRTNEKRNDRFLRGTPKGTRRARYARVHTRHTQQEHLKIVIPYVHSFLRFGLLLPRILFRFVAPSFGLRFVTLCTRFVYVYVTFARSNDNKALNLYSILQNV